MYSQRVGSNRRSRAFSVIWRLLLVVLATPAITLAEQDIETNAIDVFSELGSATVSRLEWGLQRLKQSLVEHFSIDPLSLAPSAPPFFINVDYRADSRRIEIEVGRTFPSLSRERADPLCVEYLLRVRGLLGVDRVGRPAVNGISSLVEDYFQAPHAAAPDPEFASALDNAVELRVLVASPINGAYAVCTARLTNSPITSR